MVYLLGAAAVLAVAAGLLSAVSDSTSTSSIKETQQELGKFLN
jgi:hypothetical protein